MKAKCLDNYYVNYLTYDDIENLMSQFLSLTTFKTNDIQTAIRQRTIIVYGDKVELFFKIKGFRRRIVIYDFNVESSIFNSNTQKNANFILRKFMLNKTKGINEIRIFLCVRVEN